MNYVRLTVDLSSEYSPEEMHRIAIDALIADGVAVNVTDDHGIEVLPSP